MLVTISEKLREGDDWIEWTADKAIDNLVREHITTSVKIAPKMPCSAGMPQALALGPDAVATGEMAIATAIVTTRLRPVVSLLQPRSLPSSRSCALD